MLTFYFKIVTFDAKANRFDRLIGVLWAGKYQHEDSGAIVKEDTLVAKARASAPLSIFLPNSAQDGSKHTIYPFEHPQKLINLPFYPAEISEMYAMRTEHADLDFSRTAVTFANYDNPHPGSFEHGYVELVF
jgi:hypothetical protein